MPIGWTSLYPEWSWWRSRPSKLLLPIHQAQLLSYLKLGGWKLGLLINFHVPLLPEGIKRVVLGLEETPKSIATPFTG